MPLETPIGAVIAGNVNNATPAKPTMDSAKLSFLPMFTLPDLELNESVRGDRGPAVSIPKNRSARSEKREPRRS